MIAYAMADEGVWIRCHFARGNHVRNDPKCLAVGHFCYDVTSSVLLFGMTRRKYSMTSQLLINEFINGFINGFHF